MKRSRFSEAQIIGILKEHQAGMSAPDLCRKHGISDETFMLTYGDGLSDVDLDALAAFHKSHGRLATMTMVNPHTTFGHLNYDDSGKVLGFEEKPNAAPNLINGGFFVLEPGVFDLIEPVNGSSVMWEQAPL
jgi:glucose-1-phosphate cytidylyltransferase